MSCHNVIDEFKGSIPPPPTRQTVQEVPFLNSEKINKCKLEKSRSLITGMKYDKKNKIITKYITRKEIQCSHLFETNI